MRMLLLLCSLFLAWGARAEELARGIDFDREIGRSLSSIRNGLKDLIDQARRIAPGGGQGRSSRLRQLYDRYTMEAERDVHEAAFGLSGKAALPAGRASKPAAAESTQEFGDNVELF